jgi:plastocyanin
MRRTIALAVLAVLAVALAACGGSKNAPTPTAPATSTPITSFAPAGATTFHVFAGATDGAFDIEQFMPATVRIRSGDTITWTAQGFEGHTVTFLPDGKTPVGQSDYLVPAPDTPGAREFNPVYALGSDNQGAYDGTQYTNSGFFGVPAPGDYSLTFTQPGTYAYLCMIHPLNMRGVVVVDEPGAQVPSQAALDDDAAQLKAQFAQDARDVAAAAQAERARQNNAGGGGVWQVSAGLDTPHAQVLTFTPGALEIAAGDRVIFWNSDRDFHNVVFSPQGVAPPPFPIIKPVEGRPGFRLIINPESEHETPAPTDAGPSSSFSSGIMGIGFPRFYFEQRFTTPGAYQYYCTIHVLAGMAGTITVR